VINFYGHLHGFEGGFHRREKMIYKIMLNLIISVNIFIYGLENHELFNKISYPIVAILICISLSLYMLYIIKIKNDNLLLINIIFMLIATYFYNPCFMIWAILGVEYILVKKYDVIYLYSIIIVYFLGAIKVNLSYTNIFLGFVACILIYNSIKSEEKIHKLEKYNYDLKDKNFHFEETRKEENKINYNSIQSVKIEERNNISQKLHDKIGHTLVGSIMQLEALKIIIKSDEEKGFIILDNIIENLREGMDDIRHTLKKIKPNVEELNINNLKVMMDDFSKKSNIKTELKLEGDLNEINLIYWKNILECMSEIFTNGIKYCNGDSINIHISVFNKIIRVHIKDNGNYQGEIKKGMGLLGIEERIVNLGGDVYFNNEDGFSNLIILKR